VPLDVIPGRSKIGRADLPASPESITPSNNVCPPQRNHFRHCTACGYGFRAPLALGRREAPIRALAAPE